MDHLAAAERSRSEWVLTERDGILLQIEVEPAGLELLARAEELLDRPLSPHEVGDVFLRAMSTWVARLEKTLQAAIPRARPRCLRRDSARGIPGAVRLAVWERDDGQCTFVGTTGDRCPARRLLEIDRLKAIPSGNAAKLESFRLLCRTHFVYEAKRLRAAQEGADTDP